MIYPIIEHFTLVESNDELLDITEQVLLQMIKVGIYITIDAPLAIISWNGVKVNRNEVDVCTS